MADLTTERLTDLREVAEAEHLTPGPWHQTGVEGSDYNDVVAAPHPRNPEWSEGVADTDTNDANAAHIAAFDPPTVLALLDEVERLRGVVERVEALAERGIAGVDLMPTTKAEVTQQFLYAYIGTVDRAWTDRLRSAIDGTEKGGA